MLHLLLHLLLSNCFIPVWWVNTYCRRDDVQPAHHKLRWERGNQKQLQQKDQKEEEEEEEECVNRTRLFSLPTGMLLRNKCTACFLWQRILWKECRERGFMMKLFSFLSSGQCFFFSSTCQVLLFILLFKYFSLLFLLGPSACCSQPVLMVICLFGQFSLH